jgi:hypothetical protein
MSQYPDFGRINCDELPLICLLSHLIKQLIDDPNDKREFNRVKKMLHRWMDLGGFPHPTHNAGGTYAWHRDVIRGWTAMPPTIVFVNGEWVDTETGKALPVNSLYRARHLTAAA